MGVWSLVAFVPSKQWARHSVVPLCDELQQGMLQPMPGRFPLAPALGHSLCRQEVQSTAYKFLS